MNKIAFCALSSVIFNCFTLIPLTANASEDWSGIYAGLQVGAGQGNADTSLSDSAYTINTAENVGSTTKTTSTQTGFGSLSGNITGSLIDLVVGYNFQLNSHPSFVFGGQLEGAFLSDITFETSGQRFQSSVVTQDDGVVVSTTTSESHSLYEVQDELTSMFTFLVRGGYLIRSNLLIYVLGGGAEGNFVVPDSSDLLGEQRNKWELGYTVGAGLEYRINDNWSLRGEYRFVNFDIDRDMSRESTEITDPDGPNNLTTLSSTRTLDTDTDFNFNLGKMGVVYRFDPPVSKFK